MNIVLPPFTSLTYAPDETIADVLPGDIFFIKGINLTSKLIAFGQSLRYGKTKNTFYTHCGIIINPEGGIVEADMQGVITSTLAKYIKYERKIVHLEVSDEDRAQMLLFAKSCLTDGYGFLTILSIAWSLVTGAKFSIGLDGEEICSGLVARSLERTNYIPPRDPSHLMPADLVEEFSKPLTTDQ